MAEISEIAAGGRNVREFLDMLAWSRHHRGAMLG
jgi:hypothetical protein